MLDREHPKQKCFGCFINLKYERVQKEMDVKMAEWEGLQG